MMQMTRLAARCAAATAFALCSLAAHAQDMSGLAFMTGSWLEAKDGAEVQETWAGPKAELMVAVNLTKTRSGKAEFEFLRIARDDANKIVYFASPGGRSPATPFPLKELSANRVVFENPAHDFPTRIIYRRDGDTLVARIEGTMGGKERAKEWTFKRAP